MSLFTKLVKKSVTDFLHRRKKWLIFLTFFMGLLIGINLVLNHYVDKVVGTLIKEFVHEKSKGFYKVDFKEIAYILNSGRFYMSDFQFGIHPDHQQNLVYEDLKQKYLYTASIPALHIDIIDFYSIFVNRKLKVIGVEVISPFIKIINLNKNKSPKRISFEAGSLYEVLSDHLNELKINDFLISEGEFDYETYKGPDYDNFKIKGLTFEVNNFRVNEKANARTDKFFYTDDISLEIKDQQLYLKDSIHKVTFDKFYISTRRNELGFKNFTLTRRDKTLLEKKLHDHYEISLPELRLAGIDFLSAYNNNLLIIDSIQINEPEVSIKKRSTKEKKDSTHLKLLDVAMVYHDNLKINNFNLDGANLIYTDLTKPQAKTYSIDNISANLLNVEIDTGNYSKYQYGFNFEEADLIVKDYEVTLPDSLNTIKFDEFSISSDPFEIKLKDLVIQPSLSASSADEQSLLYASIPYLVITNFDVAQAVNMDTFLIDEIYIENPDIKVVPASNKKESNSKKGPGGLFGLYESIQSISDYFWLEEMNITNGKFQLESKNTDSRLNLALNEINLALQNLKIDSLSDTKNDLFGNADVDLSVRNSLLDMPSGYASIQKLDFNSHRGRLQIDSLIITSDSVRIEQNLNITFPELLLTGINPNEILFDNKISLDTLKFQEVNIFVDLLTELSLSNNKDTNKSDVLPPISINHLLGIDYDIDIREKGFPLFIAENMKFEISEFKFDKSLSENPLNQFDYNKINLISVDNYDLYLKNQNHLFRSDRIHWNNSTSTFSMENITLKPFGKTNNRYDISIPKITMSGINLKKMLKESYYEGNEILIDQPTINLTLTKGRQEKLTSLDLGFIPILLRNRYLGAKANSFNIKNAKINFHQQIENDSLLLEVDNLYLLVDNFEVDSTTEMMPDRFLFANEVRLKGDYFSGYIQKKSDFFNINHFDISTKEDDIMLNGIYYATNTKNNSHDVEKTNLSIDNLNIIDFDFFNFTQNRVLNISEIRVDNAEYHQIPALLPANASAATSHSDSLILSSLYHDLSEEEKLGVLEKKNRNVIPDSVFLNNIKENLDRKFHNTVPAAKQSGGLNIHEKEYPFDTMLLKSIDIDRIFISDSKVTIENSDENKTGLLAPDIWFLAEGIKYDPISAKDSSRIFYTDNLLAKLTNFNYVLPDNLSAIRIDELILNSKDSSIKANNFAFVPMVKRYDYGPAKGFQSTWMQIENDSITLDNVDFLSLLNDKSFKAQSLNVHKLDISIFRDKRVEFPEWQRRPLPQTSLRGINFAFGIDTVNLHNGFISYQEHSEKAYTTGEVFFTELDATILNITNDSIRIISKPNTRIGATTKIFGEGDIKAEFMFNLVDSENIHSYGIDVEPFDLTEFNRILIPSASVQISSGESKKIIMNAKANEDYSYGEMKFYYEDLKIQLLNRETETPKGFGNVLGSFFANTFIIKSNNPRNLFLRKGDIFFERDKKRAIFNYWTKTFLSGVISSIGATNNKKKIKKMQDDNLKKIQSEKEELTSL